MIPSSLRVEIFWCVQSEIAKRGAGWGAKDRAIDVAAMRYHKGRRQIQKILSDPKTLDAVQPWRVFMREQMANTVANFHKFSYLEAKRVTTPALKTLRLVQAMLSAEERNRFDEIGLDELAIELAISRKRRRYHSASKKSPGKN